ncbi:MAG: ABC transporter permease [bacterium]|nr:ABC transporter permease [bacterium]
MTPKDVILIALGNLWRMKLRSSLTICGVIIGIAALVSMLSFGAGMQKNIAGTFKSFDLFNTLQILPVAPGEDAKLDSLPDKKLDDAAIAEILKIPGVKSVYPEVTFPVKVEFGDKSTNTSAQALPVIETELSVFKDLSAGRFFLSDSAEEVVLQQSLLKKLGVVKPDSIIGMKITLVSAKFDFGSALNSLMLGRELNPLVEVRRELTVCGVTQLNMHPEGMTWKQLILPAKTAQSIERVNFSNPLDLLSQLSSDEQKGYPYLNVRAISTDRFDAVRDSIDALGYHTFSFIDSFEQIKKSFLIFDAVLGVVGFIALVVASLGIVNTMVTSILERYREIGILKSLGAEDRHIRNLFLVESATIGFLGSVFGLAFGWVITRIGSMIATYFMLKEGAPVMELFDLPWWLITGALIFGVGVSLLAGLYPAIRATKVEPVKALRHD